MKSSTPKSPVTSDSTMQSMGWLAIITFHSQEPELSVAAVVDGKDSDNRMGVSIGFCPVSVVVLIIDPS
jgi:hypothetical protein